MSAAESARTLLFVPGTRPERFAKAVAAGADLVVIDLEDAVPAGEKEAAREAAAAWLAQGNRAAVRVNAADTAWHAADVAAVAQHAAAVVLPKAEAGDALALLGRAAPTIALLETSTGILDARAVAGTPGVVRLAIGTFDLAVELGVDPLDREALLASRSALVLASASAGLAGPVDGVRAAIDDEAGLRDETVAARRLGFAGKLCIHPRQVAPVCEVLRPTEDEVAWARRILTVVDATDTGGVAAIDGAMVDKPVVDRARRILDTLDSTPDTAPGPTPEQSPEQETR